MQKPEAIAVLVVCYIGAVAVGYVTPIGKIVETLVLSLGVFLPLAVRFVITLLLFASGSFIYIYFLLLIVSFFHWLFIISLLAVYKVCHRKLFCHWYLNV